MNQSPLFEFDPLLLLSLLIFTFLILTGQPPSLAAAVDPYFANCSLPTTCGRHPIKFPFYIDRPYCGNPGFNVSCTNQILTLTVSGHRLLVNEIFYHNLSIIVSMAADVGSQEPRCFPQIRNFSVEANERFSLAPKQTELFILSSCNITSAPELSRYRIFNCSGEDVSNSSLVLFGDDPALGNVSRICKNAVVSPVRAREGNGGGGGGYLALRRGFVLEWIASDCMDCSATDGFCGFNYSNRHFQCFCPDRPHAARCQDPGDSRRLKLGIVAGIGGSVILLIVLFYIAWRSNKLKHATSYCFEGNISKNLSSRSDLEDSSIYPGVRTFSYNELEKITNNFDNERELGDGGFGLVFYGKLKDGREVAIKRLYQHNYRRMEQFINEVDILARLRHKNLVSLYGCTSRHSRDLLLVYEYVSNGTVAHHLHGDQAKASPLTWQIRMSIAIETASALAYLHASDVIHRDVKTDNILLDNNFCVKVADFGLSKQFPTDATHVSTAPQGTPGYVDPEYYQCYQLTDKSDVYSYGVVLVELISSMPAVDFSRHRHEVNLANLAINRIQSRAAHELIDPRLWSESSEAARRMIIAVAELAFQCLQHEKEMRPAMDEVLEQLQRIQDLEHRPDNLEDTKRSNDEPGSLEPPFPSPYHEDATLLKTAKQTPPSPISVTENWISSRSTTPNTSG